MVRLGGGERVVRLTLGNELRAGGGRSPEPRVFTSRPAGQRAVVAMDKSHEVALEMLCKDKSGGAMAREGAKEEKKVTPKWPRTWSWGWSGFKLMKCHGPGGCCSFSGWADSATGDDVVPS